MMYWYGDHMSGWGYGLGVLSMILFWGLLIAGVVILVRYLSRSSRPQPPAPPTAPQHPQTPEQVLAERFARGEIDADEYRQRLATLHEQSHPAAMS
jgi:putative membrane protein